MGARQSANRPIRSSSGKREPSTFRLPVPASASDKISALDNSLIAFNNRHSAFAKRFLVRVAVLLLRADVCGLWTCGRTGGRRVEAPPWLSLFFSPFPPLTPLPPPPNLSPPHGTGKIGARDQGRYGTARNGRCVTRRPFPSTLTPFYQIRGNRNFARSLDVVDTHRHRYSMTRHCVCVCISMQG